MTSILFVDDEPLLLGAIARGLRKDRDRWHMVFVEGAAAALEALEREHFDVVVTDLQMDGMDGAQLLERVRAKHRATVRILMSGSVEATVEAMARTFAHEVVVKPSPISELRECIERQLASGLTSSARFRSAVRKISERALRGP